MGAAVQESAVKDAFQKDLELMEETAALRLRNASPAVASQLKKNWN
jgi:hypothetical protein